MTFQTGWDDSKRTGGIVVEIESSNGTKTWFNDVVIENNVTDFVLGKAKVTDKVLPFDELMAG